jgi:hypothetical protein
MARTRKYYIVSKKQLIDLEVKGQDLHGTLTFGPKFK